MMNSLLVHQWMRAGVIRCRETAPRDRRFLWVLLIASPGTGLTACPADDQPLRDRSAADSVAAALPVVTVTASDSVLEVPDTLSEGWTTFRLVNRGTELHMAMLVRLESGRSFEEYLDVYGEAVRTDGPRPEWATRLGGPGAADPGGTSNATHYLEPGLYVLIDIMNIGDGIPNFMQKPGLARPFVVEAAPGTRSSGKAPEADVEILLLDYAFNLRAPLAPGRQTIRIENIGAQPHEIALVEMAPGATIEDFLAWMRNPEGPPPMVGTRGGVAAMAAGREAYFEVDLEAGDYALLCFVTAPDGREHTAHGMFRHVRVG